MTAPLINASLTADWDIIARSLTAIEFAYLDDLRLNQWKDESFYLESGLNISILSAKLEIMRCTFHQFVYYPA